MSRDGMDKFTSRLGVQAVKGEARAIVANVFDNRLVNAVRE